MKLKLLTPIGSALALIGFFSPWMSCGMMTFSGYDLASGASSDGLGKGPDADLLLWLVPIFALTILILFFLFDKKRMLKKAMIPVIGLSVAGLVVTGMKYIDVHKAKTGVLDAAKETVDSFSLDSVTENTVETDGGTTTEESSTNNESSKNADFSKMMSSMIKIEWGYWLTLIAFIIALSGAWNFKNDPEPTVIDDIGPPLPEDQSHINEDLGL